MSESQSHKKLSWMLQILHFSHYYFKCKIQLLFKTKARIIIHSVRFKNEIMAKYGIFWKVLLTNVCCIFGCINVYYLNTAKGWVNAYLIVPLENFIFEVFIWIKPLCLSQKLTSCKLKTSKCLLRNFSQNLHRCDCSSLILDFLTTLNCKKQIWVLILQQPEARKTILIELNWMNLSKIYDFLWIFNKQIKLESYEIRLRPIHQPSS